MRTSAPGLVPLFRSDTQARLLAVLFDHRGVEHSVTELATILGAPLSTVAREIDRLDAHGIVATRMIGKTKLVAANWGLTWADALAEMLAHTVGLPRRLAEALADVPGIDTAGIFGSWAARHAGEEGPPPNDIDLLVVGTADFGAVRAALRPVERDLGVVVNPTIVSRQRWEDADGDPFLTTVRSRPIFPLDLTTRRVA